MLEGSFSGPKLRLSHTHEGGKPSVSCARVWILVLTRATTIPLPSAGGKLEGRILHVTLQSRFHVTLHTTHQRAAFMSISIRFASFSKRDSNMERNWQKETSDAVGLLSLTNEPKPPGPIPCLSLNNNMRSGTCVPAYRSQFLRSIPRAWKWKEEKRLTL